MKKLYPTLLFLALSIGAIGQSTRTVLLELSESNWIQDNSEIICAKEALKSSFDNDELAIISFHWDEFINGGDPMFQNFADEWAQTFEVSVWGRGAIDRVSYNGTTMTSLASDLWSDTIAARINRTTDATVTMPELLYDANHDEVFARLHIEFTDSTYGIINREMRFFLYVVQDGVVADQVIDAGNLGNCQEFPPPYDTVNINGTDYLYKPDYSHNDVAVANPSGFSGVDNVLPQQVKIGNEFTTTFSFSKPAGADLSDLRVIGFVANYDAGDITKNEVINVVQGSTFTTYDKDDLSDPNHPENPNNPNSQYNPDNWPTGINEIDNFDPKVSLSPNPVSQLGIIEYNMPRQEEVSVQITDINGVVVKEIYRQTLSAGPQKAAFSANGLANGVYYITIKSPSFSAWEPLVIVK